MSYPSRSALRILLAAASIAQGGCASSPPAQHYTLAPLADPAQMRMINPAAVRIAIGPVDLPALVDRPQLVVRRTGHRVEILESERWAEPLRDAVPRLLAARLARQLDQAWVMPLTDPLAERAQIRLMVDIVDIELRPDTEALIEAQWSMRAVPPAASVGSAPTQLGGGARANVAEVNANSHPMDPTGAVAGTIVARVPAGAGTEALVASLATALGQVADELARLLIAMPGLDLSKH